MDLIELSNAAYNLSSLAVMCVSYWYFLSLVLSLSAHRFEIYYSIGSFQTGDTEEMIG